MMRRFRIRKLADRVEPPAQPVNANDEIPDYPFDWSVAELDALSVVSDDDIKDTAAWLARLQLTDALHAFNS